MPAREPQMKLICIEEHAVDPAIVKAAQAALNEEAPYFGLASSAGASGPTDSHRPTLLRMDEAIRLGADLGAGRIEHMDAHGIDVQVVSYSSPVQLAPDDQAAALARAANDRLAEAITARPARDHGFLRS